MLTSRAMMHTLRSSPDRSCASRCAAHLPHAQQKAQQKSMHVCWGLVACLASTWVPRATALIPALTQSSPATHLTASALRLKRTFFWSALFTRLAVPVYSQATPADGLLLLSPHPDPDPASIICAGAMFVTSFRATCACHRALRISGLCASLTSA